MRKKVFVLFLIILCTVTAFTQEDNEGTCIKGNCTNGKGTWTSPDGHKYVGQFKDGKADGQGTYTDADGSKYVGQFKDDQYEGQGTMTYADGQKSVGQWVNNEFTSGICYDKKGKKVECDLSEQTMSQDESGTSENKLPNGDFPFGVDYSGYDTITKLKAKNPSITFSQIKYPYDAGGRTQFQTVLGQSPITTEATFTFNSKRRLVNVIIKKKGAALDVYEPQVEKYTQIYGNPKSSTPFTTDLRQNASFATCSWENDKRDTLLLLVIPMDGYNVPSIMLVENWKDKY